MAAQRGAEAPQESDGEIGAGRSGACLSAAAPAPGDGRGGPLSSTGRGQRLGGAEDFYRSPSWTVRRLLEDYKPRGGLWLEPGAGAGNVIRAVNSVRSDVRWRAIEIRREEQARLESLGARVSIGDFLEWHPASAADGEEIVVVAGNPPFNRAQDFIDHARRVAPNADVVLQLRLNFVGSEERADFMRRCPPDIYTLPNRPSYYLRLTDSIEYGWLVWPPGERSAGTFRVLASTPIEERQRDMPTVDTCPACHGRGKFHVSLTEPLEECARCFGHGKVVLFWPEDNPQTALFGGAA